MLTLDPPSEAQRATERILDGEKLCLAFASSTERKEQRHSDDQPDLGDDYFRPFFRALRNLVITFALAEAKSLYEDIASRR